MINPKRKPADPTVIADNVMGLADPQTVSLLRREGVDLVVVHRGLAKWPLPTDAPPGYPIERAYSFSDEEGVLSSDQLRRVAGLRAWYDMEIYRVPDGPAAPAVVLPAATGWGPTTPVGWTTAVPTAGPDAELQIVTFGDPVGAGEVGLDLVASAGRPQIEFRQGEQVLWSGSFPCCWRPWRATPAAGAIWMLR